MDKLKEDLRRTHSRVVSVCTSCGNTVCADIHYEHADKPTMWLDSCEKCKSTTKQHRRKK